ncbi:unnamed protein product [Gadus morhua 'NCC']
MWLVRPSALGLAYGRSSLMVAPEAERFGTGLWQVKPHAGSRDLVVWDWLMAGPASWWPQRPSGVGLAYGRSSLMVAPEAQWCGTGLWQVQPHGGPRGPVVWDWLKAGGRTRDAQARHAFEVKGARCGLIVPICSIRTLVRLPVLQDEYDQAEIMRPYMEPSTMSKDQLLMVAEILLGFPWRDGRRRPLKPGSGVLCRAGSTSPLAAVTLQSFREACRSSYPTPRLPASSHLTTT